MCPPLSRPRTWLRVRTSLNPHICFPLGSFAACAAGPSAAVFRWATEAHGAVLGNITFGLDAWGGSGLFLKAASAGGTAVDRGGVIAVLPRALRVGREAAGGPNGCVRGLSLDCPDLSALALLLLAWLPSAPTDPISTDDDDDDDGKVLSDASAFALYAATLPTLAAVGNAVAMTPTDVAAWVAALPATSAGCDDSRDVSCEGVAEAIDGVRGMVRSAETFIRALARPAVHEALHGAVPTERLGTGGGGDGGGDGGYSDGGSSALAWALAMVVSRSHGFGTRDRRWLTIIFDLANHKPASAVRGGRRGA